MPRGERDRGEDPAGPCRTGGREASGERGGGATPGVDEGTKCTVSSSRM